MSTPWPDNYHRPLQHRIDEIETRARRLAEDARRYGLVVTIEQVHYGRPRMGKHVDHVHVAPRRIGARP